MQRRLARVTLVALCLLGTGACHTYRPMTYDELAPGLEVRARITGAFADSLDAILFRDSRVFEGTVVEERPTGVLLEIPVDQGLNGMRYRTLAQRVAIPESAFVDLELKEFDQTRSLGALAVAGGVVGAMVVAQLQAGSGGGGRRGGGGPVDALIPVTILRALIR